MFDEFNIVIFKNKRKKKVIKKYKSLDKAIEFFDRLIRENNNIVFEKLLENGTSCDHNLLIIGQYKPDGEFFIKDKFGKNVKIFSENNDFSIYKISNYKIEEKIEDLFRHHIHMSAKVAL